MAKISISATENKLKILTGHSVRLDRNYSFNNLYVFREVKRTDCHFVDITGQYLLGFNSANWDLTLYHVNKSCLFVKSGSEGILFNTISCKYLKFDKLDRHKNNTSTSLLMNDYLALTIDGKLNVYDDNLDTIFVSDEYETKSGVLINPLTELQYLMDNNMEVVGKGYEIVKQTSYQKNKFYIGIKYDVKRNIPYKDRLSNINLKYSDAIKGLTVDMFSAIDRRMVQSLYLDSEEYLKTICCCFLRDKYVYQLKQSPKLINIMSLKDDKEYDNVVVHFKKEYFGYFSDEQCGCNSVVYLQTYVTKCKTSFYSSDAKYPHIAGGIYVASDSKMKKWGLLNLEFSVIVPLRYDSVKLSHIQGVYSLHHGSLVDIYFENRLIKDTGGFLDYDPALRKLMFYFNGECVSKIIEKL